MKTAVAIRHVYFEDLGMLEGVLHERGYAIRYVEAPLDDLSEAGLADADLMIVLGGPIGAYEEAVYPFLGPELELVKRRLAQGGPLLGICLGAQLIARMLGADVYPMGVKEIGFSPLQLTEDGRQSLLAALDGVPVLHWHGDQFDIPEGARHLAATDIGRHQAFMHGRNVLGLQFHLEAEVGRLEQWLVGHASELAQAGCDLGLLRMQASQYGPRLQALAADVIGSWLDGVTSPA